MGTEEKLEEIFLEELKKCVGEKVKTLPLSLKVEQDHLPDVERWRTNE